MTELPWFPLYARDWLAGEGTSMMLPEQEGAFMRLLCVSWGDGTDEPSLPDDDKALAQISRLGPRWKKLGALVRAQFEARNGRLFNPRLSRVWTEQRERSQKLSENGRKGGRAKAAHVAGLQPGSSERLAKPYQSEAEAEADTETTIDDDARAREPSVADVPGEPAITAIYLTRWANSAINEKWGVQTDPLMHGAAAELADELRALGYEWRAVQLSIARQCRESRLKEPPSTVNYFRNGIKDDIAKAAARADLAANPTPMLSLVPKAEPTPRLDRAREIYALAKQYGLLSWAGNEAEYRAAQQRAASDPRAGATFLRDIAGLKLFNGLNEMKNDHFAAVEVARRMTTLGASA